MISEQQRKKKILFIEFGPGFGGSVVSLSLLLKYNIQKNIQSVVFMSHDDKESVCLLKRYAVDVCVARPFYRGLWLRPKIEKTKNDILRWILVFFNSMAGLILNVGFWGRAICFAKQHEVNLVHINCLISLYSAVIVFFLRVPCVCHVRTLVEFSKILNFSEKLVSHFFAVSNFVQSELVAANIALKKITVVNPVVDWDDFCSFINSERMPAAINCRFRIGVFGCLIPWKGQHVLIEAAEHLKKIGKIDGCHFFIIGSSPQGKVGSYERLLRGMVAEKKLENVVHFLGYRKDVAYLISQMDVIVHTSVEPEPFGRIIIEAMGLGKPVVATDMGGVPEIIIDGETGLLIPPNDFQKLSDRIEMLRSDKILCSRLGAAAKQSSRLKFSMDAHEKIVEIYHQLLNKHF